MLRARERDHRREPDRASISFEADFCMETRCGEDTTHRDQLSTLNYLPPLNLLPASAARGKIREGSIVAKS
jgi:hypothetical protein